MVLQSFWYQNRRYYYYDTFDTKKEATLIAIYYKRENKSKWIIQKKIHPFYAQAEYLLYLTKVKKILQD